jgi:hypothetical protein
MGGGRSARGAFHTPVTQHTQIDTVQQMFRVPSKTGAMARLQLVNERIAQILPNCVAAARRIPRLLRGGMNTAGHEPKLGAAPHPERCPRVMSQTKTSA